MRAPRLSHHGQTAPFSLRTHCTCCSAGKGLLSWIHHNSRHPLPRMEMQNAHSAPSSTVFEFFFRCDFHNPARYHWFTRMMGMPCLCTRFPPGLLPVVCDLFAAHAFGRRHGGILIIMVYLCREFYNEALCLLQFYRCLIIIRKRLFPFFIQFGIPVFQAYDHVGNRQTSECG